MSILKDKMGQQKKTTTTTENHQLDLDKILVEVYSQPSSTNDDVQSKKSSEKHAEELFLEINKAEPVKLVDMPGIVKSGDQKIITEAAQLLREQFPDMFKASQQCRAPHLNIDNLRDHLFAAKVLERHTIKNTKMLLAWLVEQNDQLASKYNDAKKNPKNKAEEKARKYEFYLGLEPHWLNQ